MTDRWKNRRRMAWLAVSASLAFPLLLLAVPDGSSLATVAIPFYSFTSVVVGSYIGWATADDRWQKPEESNA